MKYNENDMLNFIRYYDNKDIYFDTYEEELEQFIKAYPTSDSGDFDDRDMIRFIKYYFDKNEEDCFHTYEEELEDYLKNTVVLRLTKGDIDLMTLCINATINNCGRDSYDSEKYDSPSDQISDIYWLLNLINNINT